MHHAYWIALHLTAKRREYISITVSHVQYEINRILFAADLGYFKKPSEIALMPHDSRSSTPDSRESQPPTPQKYTIQPPILQSYAPQPPAPYSYVPQPATLTGTRTASTRTVAYFSEQQNSQQTETVETVNADIILWYCIYRYLQIFCFSFILISGRTFWFINKLAYY